MLKQPGEKKRTLSGQNLYFVAGLRVQCLLMQKKTLCRPLMTVPDVQMCISAQKRENLARKAIFFFQKFSISHYVIDQWGILHSVYLLKGKKVSE